jgi:ribosomal protein S18 acetylase RimI-like enzyme
MNNNKQQTGKMRRANIGDVNALLDICRANFKDSLTWQSPLSLGMKWWISAIGSTACETWVCVNEGRIAGFCVLITDENTWAKERPTRNGSFFRKLLLSATHPKTIFAYIRKKIVRTIIRTGKNQSKDVIDLYDGDRVWIELTAVAPKQLRQGIATQMFSFCEKRTLELHRQMLTLVVMSDNNTARCFYERCGFTFIGQRPAGCVYVKSVNGTDRQKG